MKKAVTDAPKTIADAEEQITDAKATLDAEQKKSADLRGQLAWEQKQPTFLRAAQFNVSVLEEKQSLEEKLEADVKGMQEGTKDLESAKATAMQRVDASKKTLAETGAKIPVLESALVDLKTDVPALEKSVAALKQEEAQTSTKVEELKKALAAKEVELAGITQEKAKQIAAPQKAIADLSSHMTTLQKQVEDWNGQLDAPLKLQTAKRLEQAKAEFELGTASQPIAGLENTFGRSFPRSSKPRPRLPKRTQAIRTSRSLEGAGRIEISISKRWRKSCSGRRHREDRETAQGLKAWNRQLCKRLLSMTYLQAFNTPGVRLTSRPRKGVERSPKMRRRRGRRL